MVQLVDLEEAKQGLRVFHDDDDDTIELLIGAASESVLAYLKDGANDFMGDSPIEVPARVKWATIYMVGWLYENRDNNRDGEFELGYLPRPVMSLLYQMRDPALA